MTIFLTMYIVLFNGKISQHNELHINCGVEASGYEQMVESVFLDNAKKHQSTGNSAYWTSDYEKRLKALFEAIIAEDIVSLPSQDDVNTIKSGKQARLDI